MCLPSASHIPNLASGLSTFIFQSKSFTTKTLRAMINQYSWSKIGLVYSLDNDGFAGTRGKQHICKTLQVIEGYCYLTSLAILTLLNPMTVRDEILAFPSMNVTLIGVPPESSDALPYVETLIKYSLNVAIIYNSRLYQLEALATAAVDQKWFDQPGRAFIYLNNLDSLPTSLPAGSLLVDSIEALTANRNPSPTSSTSQSQDLSRKLNQDLFRPTTLFQPSVEPLSSHSHSDPPPDRMFGIL
jgi:hypothetical protein